MTLIESSKLLQERIRKAVALIERLRADKVELLDRLKMVTNHNNELQELLEKNSTDQAAIESAITEALETLDSLELDDIGDFGTMSSEELEAAESFTLDGAAQDIETFEDKSL
ncbi:MAG: hypothetical protein K6G51_04045 [Sphaerochaetaceae bacterium]|nr:hypothetical protein [Sphaerochaetaceae bacterium]